jgi:curli biogenesis system outer membrane secretion channel CsgG
MMEHKEDTMTQRTLGIAMAIGLLAVTGCQSTTTGQVKDDVSVTGQTQRMEAAGSRYSGPQYTVAIIKFANKTPSRVLGLGESATDILRTMVKNSGLEPIDVTAEGMQQQDEMIKLQQTGAVKTGKKNAAEGFDSIDYRIQGAITAYSELEEGSDALVYQKKIQIARVQVDYSLIDVASGKSLLAESGMGEYRKETGGAMGFGSKSTADVGLRDGALRDALSKVMEKMVNKLNSQPFTGRIVAMDGQTAIIRAGEKSKLASGTKLGVYRPGQDLIDPDTGRSLGKREKMIGELTLVNHSNERVSEAKVSSGAGFQPGDVIRAVK